MSDDKATAYLAEVERRSESPLAHVTSLPVSHEGVRQLMESAGDVPRLIAAVRAGLELADDWAATQGDGPGYIAVRACGIRVRSVIAAELLKEVPADEH